MNQIIFNQQDLSNNTLKSSDPFILEHLHNILKAKAQEQLNVAVLNQGKAQATIKEITQDTVTLELCKCLETSFHPNINLYVGACRPASAKKVLEHAATFGVKSINFFQTKLSEKSYLSSKIYENNETTKYLLAGLAQSGLFYRLPQVNRLKTLPQAKENTFLLSKNGSPTLPSTQPVNNDREINLIIGPERGFTQDEEDHLSSHGTQKIKIAPTILRTEYATLSILSILAFNNLNKG